MLTSKLEGPHLPRYYLVREIKIGCKNFPTCCPIVRAFFFYFNLSKIFVKSAKFFLVTRIFFIISFSLSQNLLSRPKIVENSKLIKVKIKKRENVCWLLTFSCFWSLKRVKKLKLTNFYGFRIRSGQNLHFKVCKNLLVLKSSPSPFA
jgi:hypothetical protein